MGDVRRSAGREAVPSQERERSLSGQCDSHIQELWQRALVTFGDPLVSGLRCGASFLFGRRGRLEQPFEPCRYRLARLCMRLLVFWLQAQGRRILEQDKEQLVLCRREGSSVSAHASVAVM